MGRAASKGCRKTRTLSPRQRKPSKSAIETSKDRLFNNCACIGAAKYEERSMRSVMNESETWRIR